MRSRKAKKQRQLQNRAAGIFPIPIENIKVEKADDLETRNVIPQAFVAATARNGPPIRVKRERPNDINNNATARPVMARIKTEKSVDDGGDVTFVPNAVVKIEVIDSMPPQKKRKLNNGKAKCSKNNRNKFAVVDQVRNPAAARNQNKPPRNNEVNFNANNSVNWPIRSADKVDDKTSERLLKQICIDSTQLCNLTKEKSEQIKNLFDVLICQTKAESRQIFIDRLIVAKIRILQSITINLKAVFRAMRENMIDWVENCQYQGKNTPRYHNAFIDKANIFVMCNDSYAYNCLRDYINFTYQNPSSCHVAIEFLPRYTGRVLYCYVATVNDIINDTDRFIQQIVLHTTSRAGVSLCADQWILARQCVHSQDGFTSFVFLMDYNSSVALDYVYKNNLFICMLDVKFAYRGSVACNF